ncbi:hypothetical protein E6C55_07345 [Cohnella fermenti]|uniref:Alpha-amylase n=1 Tax=Cohnella fermenti TaxID=2565925 RepID=A0A4S4C3E8_9BACL|nr:hypothetical protein E6C55_07345 [Cohnella fermenti]
MQAVFNNGSGTWDNNGGKNYTFQQGTWTYDSGTITAGAPAGAIVDTTAPSAPTNVTASAKTSGSVSLSWTASTDNVGVTGYEIYRGDVKVGTSTTTTYTDSGLSASTEYRYAVKAYDAAGNVSTASSTLAVTTDAPAASNAATIYYKRGYSTPYFHYAPTGGTWTTSPGKAMTASTDYSGYSVITVDLGTATSMQAVFNNGSGTWDNNGGKNYTFQQGTWTYDSGTITAGAPASALVDTTAPSAPTNVAAASASASTATVSWLSSTDNVGVTGYVIYRDGTKVGTSTTTTYADSGLAANTTYSYTVKATDAAGNLSDASAAATVKTAAGNSATIYYKRGYSTPYFHYAPTGGTWTTSPGKAMTASTDYSGYSVITVDLGTATSMQAVFNNGSGTWDNNGGKNYTFQQGTWTYDSGTITAGVPGTDANSNDGDDEPITGTVEWSKQSIYFIMTDRFVDGDTSNDNYGGFNSDKSNPSKWHGGDFQGIIDNLDYIKNMGFTAIWITPVTMQNSVYAYHGYHTYDFYSVDGHLGTMDKFKELVSTAHNKGIAVMLDVVVNHTCDCSTGNVAAPFNQYDWYHHRGTISDSDYNNNNTDMIENGEVAGLDDLNQENPAVEQALNNWIQWLIGESKVDGLRVDTAKHVPKWYLKSFDTAANTFTIGEVFHGDPAVVGDYSNYLDAVLDFPMYYTITDVFAKDGSMYNIQSRYASDSKYRDTRYNGLFIDNHDTKRFLNVATSGDKWKQLKAALGFILTSRGIPIVYQGTELGYSGGDDPANREDVVPNANHELYKYIAAVNAVRNKHAALQNGTQKEKWVDTYVYGFQRSKDGDEAVVLINNAWTSQTRTIPNLDNMSGVGTLYNQLGTDSYSVSNGSITVTLAPKEVKILTKS